MYCSTAIPDWKAFRAKYTPEFWREFEARDTQETLYIDTRWVSLYSSEDEKVPIERVRDCLRMLNLVYSGQNTEDLGMIPDSAQNPFKRVLGNPNIQFLPLDPSTLVVEYQKINGTLSSSSPVDDAAAKAGVVAGVMNIYMGNSGSGSILGQAELSSNIVFGLYSSIGGFTVPGALPGYSQGKTMAHEIGHALGLNHLFQDNLCDNQSVYTDIPEQIRPNFTTELYQTSEGAWEMKGDNRSKDRALDTNLSCLHIQPDPATAPNEMGVNIMDYGLDPVSLMFSKNQADMMRSRLLDADNTTLTLKNSGDLSISSTGASASVTLTIVPVADTGLSAGAIVGIVIGSLVAVLLLAWLIYSQTSGKKSGFSKIKAAAAYEAAFQHNVHLM